MKKKPTKKNQSKKKTPRFVNVLSPLYPRDKLLKEETKVPLREFTKAIRQQLRAERWANAADKEAEALRELWDARNQLDNIKRKIAGLKSGEARRKKSAYRYDWS